MREIFFKHVFADVTGHAKLIDEYLSNVKCSIHKTYVDNKICFHDSLSDDPDWKVKLSYLLMIAATTEKVKGASDLWKSGSRPYSRHEYPDYGKYMTEKEFKCFKAAAPYAFCDKSEWFKEKRDKSWDIFLPALSSYNERRQKFFKSYALAALLDESMSGYCPKTSKTGGLPNISYEP